MWRTYHEIKYYSFVIVSSIYHKYCTLLQYCFSKKVEYNSLSNFEAFSSIHSKKTGPVDNLNKYGSD